MPPGYFSTRVLYFMAKRGAQAVQASGGPPLAAVFAQEAVLRAIGRSLLRGAAGLTDSPTPYLATRSYYETQRGGVRTGGVVGH